MVIRTAGLATRLGRRTTLSVYQNHTIQRRRKSEGQDKMAHELMGLRRLWGVATLILFLYVMMETLIFIAEETRYGDHMYT